MPGLRPRRLFDLLLLHQHLRRRLEALMLQQPLHQLAPRVFRVRPDHVRGIARQQRLRLDMNQQRRHVNKLARRIHIGLLQLVAVVQKLRRHQRDRNVVDVDILLADQVQQQVERPVVHLPHRHRERRLRSLFLRRVLVFSRFALRLRSSTGFGSSSNVSDRRNRSSAPRLAASA